MRRINIFYSLALQSLTGIRGIWGLSGLWLVVTGPDNVQLVLIIWVLTGGRVGQWLVSDGGGEVVSYYYQDRRGQTGVLITTWHGGGGRPLSSGHKLQEITTNWCQWPGPGPDCYFFLQNLWLNNHNIPTSSLGFIQSQHSWNKISHLSPRTTEPRAHTSDLTTFTLPHTFYRNYRVLCIKFTKKKKSFWFKPRVSIIVCNWVVIEVFKTLYL